MTQERQQRPSAAQDWRAEPGTVAYAYETPVRVRAGFIGCGVHAYRNVYPAFRYAPVELVAVTDLQEDRAAAFAREFGAQRSYTDYREMLAREELDCVFVVTNYRRAGPPALSRHRDGCDARRVSRLDREAPRDEPRASRGDDGG